MRFLARFPGAAGDGRVVLRETARPATQLSLQRAPVESVLRITFTDAANNALYVKNGAGAWLQDDGVTALDLSIFDSSGNLLTPAGGPVAADLLTLAVTVADANDFAQSWEDLGYGPNHPQAIHSVLQQNPDSRAAALTNLIWAEIGDAVTPSVLRAGVVAITPDANGDRVIPLAGGSDGGNRPRAAKPCPAVTPQPWPNSPTLKTFRSWRHRDPVPLEMPRRSPMP